MSTTEVRTDASGTASIRNIDMSLEVVVIPVSDVDRAKQFYTGLGWRLDADFATGDDFRIVQLTPPGSGCSIQFGTNVSSATPGSIQDLYLIVSDIQATRDALVDRGVQVSDVFHEATLGGRFHDAAKETWAAGPSPDRSTYGSFASFSDPDGNGWLMQEITTRLPGRVAGDTTYGSAGELSQALRRAAAAHGEHEARTGEADPNWPDWYADYMVREQSGEEPPA